MPRKASGELASLANEIDAALGKGTARRQPLLLGLLSCSRALSSLRRGSHLQPPAPFVLERRKLDEIAHGRLLDAWHICFGSKAVSAKQAVQLASAADPSGSARALGAVLKKIATGSDGKLSARSLGKWLQRYQVLRIGGRRFVFKGQRDHVALWLVERHERGHRR